MSSLYGYDRDEADDDGDDVIIDDGSEDGSNANIADGLDGPDGVDRLEIFLPAVQSLVNALGGYEDIETSPGKIETVYRPGDSVLAVLKDLKKLWRKDDSDDERTVARCMAQAGLMRELIAIVCECTDRGDWGRKVSLMACDLIAALTWPIDVALELKEMEDEGDVVTDYASLLRAQIEYKAMILRNGGGVLKCILKLMLPLFAKSRRDEREDRVISLCLHIVRNLLSIRDLVAEGSATGEKEELSTLQSTLIMQLDKFTYLQLLLTITSNADRFEFNSFNVLALDVLHLVFRCIKPRDLGQDQARAPIENLTKLLDAEKRQRALSTRTGMTRHSRFGTTITVRAGDQRVILHKQNAITASAGAILDGVKRKRASRVKRVDELTVPANLSPDAIIVLQKFTKDFIESSFNPFIASILSDIRMERSKIRPKDSIRVLFVGRFCLEYLLLLRKKAASKAPGSSDGKVTLGPDLALGLVAEMAEIDSVRWVVARMKITMDDRPPQWTELQASLDCFTQILLLIDAMSVSEDQEDIEVAEILQNQIYYNGDILDSSLAVVNQYKDQSVGYLDSVIHFAYVLLRMLEKYSKQKSFMFVRKRRAARKKRQQAKTNSSRSAPIPEEYDNEDEEANEPDQDAPSYAEHAFTFSSFEKRFASETVVNTLLTYLSRYQDFDESEQMKRVVGLMHRQIIKTQAEGLYFKVSCLYLFRKILDDQAKLPKDENTKNLIHLITFVLRKFFKRVADDPFLIVEALTPKSRGRWKDLSSYKSDDEDDDGMGGQRARIKEKMGPAELEFKKNAKLSWSQQMGVIVSMLVKDGHEDWIRWVIEVLEVALAARTEVVLAIDGDPQILLAEDDDGERMSRNFGGPSKDALDKFVPHDLAPDTDERRAATTKDSHFRLMLRLLSFDMTMPEPESLGPAPSSWFLPAKVPPATITTHLGALKQFLSFPPDLETDPKTLLRKARAPRPRATDSEDEDENGERRVKRKPKPKAIETQVFKSAAFIYDSDDDEDADAAFFAREAELRRKMQEVAETSGNTMRAQGGTKKRKRGDARGKGKEKDREEGDGIEGVRSQDVIDDEDEGMLDVEEDDEDDDEDVDAAMEDSQQVHAEDDNEEDNEDSSQQPRAKSVRLTRDDPDSDADGEDDIPTQARTRRRIVADDEDED